MLKTAERIITMSDLQQTPDMIVQNAQQQPLVIIAEGRPAAYMLSVEMFDTLMERLLELEREELVSNIAEGEKQFDNGDYLTLKEAVAEAEIGWQAQESSP